MRAFFKQRDEGVYLFHVAVFTLIYTIYGQHICPILNSKNFFAVFAPCAGMLLLLAAGRSLIMPKVLAFQHDRNLRWSFWLDFSLFLGAGLVISIFNGVYFHVPLENSLKVGVSFVTLGYYITLDLSLKREHRLAKRIIAREAEFPENGKTMPVTQKFMIFSIVNLFVLAIVCLLVVYKDLLYIGRSGVTDILVLIILVEIAFVLLVIGGYTVNAIKQYSRNLKLALETEHNALIAVSSGDLNNRAAITSKDEFGEVAKLTNQMIEQLEMSIQNLTKTQNAFLVSLVSLAAKRDNETGMHLRRTQNYIAELARTLRKRPSHRLLITESCVDLLFHAAPLHDIGKVGIPDAILQKPGRLDASEFDIMKTHTTIGAAALEDAAAQLDDSSLINMAQEIVISHHERWDGQGYPFGIEGTEIPLSGRLMAVADVYDALRSKRVYKPAMTHAQAVAIIEEGSGTQFDADVVDAFLACEARFEQIASSFKDELPEDESAPLGSGAQKPELTSQAA